MKSRALPMAFDNGGDLADIGVVTRALADMARAGVKAIVWSGGGEPTTHPHWHDAIRAASAGGLEQGMYTLGGLLDEAGAALLADRLSWVVVSLDCVDAETYAAEKGVPASRFEAACTGVRMLASHQQAVVGVSFLLHATNWYHVKRMYSLAMELGAHYVTFRPAIETNAATPSICRVERDWIDAAVRMLRQVERWPGVEVDAARFEEYRDWQGHGYTSCTGVRLNATVTPDGRVWVCPQRRGVSGSSIGDLSRESFADIWARHPGRWTVDNSCRVMCRLHPVNAVLHAIATPKTHGAFV